MQNADPRRIALMRDLLMDYPQEPLSMHPPVPEGIAPEEEDAWIEDWLMRNAPQPPLEGRYGEEYGRPNAAFAPQSLPVTDDVRAMGEYTNFMLPRAGQEMPVPDDPEQAPTRVQALAQRLRRG